MPLPQILDSTQIVTLRTCTKKFYNSFILQRDPFGEKSIPLLAGGAFAAGLEEYRYAWFIDGCQHAECLDRAFLAATINWGEADPLPTEFGKPHLLVARTLPRVMYALDRYVTHYPPGKDLLQPIPLERDGKTSFEYNALIPLDGPGFPLHPELNEPFLWSIRPDTLGIYDKRLPVFSDEKTTGALGKTWAQQWPLRNQFLGYAWGLRQLGRQENRCLVRGICILKEDIKFVESLIHYPDHLLDDFETTLKEDLAQIIARYEAGSWPKQFGDGCTSYGGCIWGETCRMSTHSANHVLQDTPSRVWNPAEPHEENPLIEQWHQHGPFYQTRKDLHEARHQNNPSPLSSDEPSPPLQLQDKTSPGGD